MAGEMVSRSKPSSVASPLRKEGQAEGQGGKRSGRSSKRVKTMAINAWILFTCKEKQLQV